LPVVDTDDEARRGLFGGMGASRPLCRNRCCGCSSLTTITPTNERDRLALLKPEGTTLAALQHNPVGILVRKRAHGAGHRNTLGLGRQPLRPFSRLINRDG
jgi:hypothetical protein